MREEGCAETRRAHLQVAAQLLGRLAERARDLLDLLLVLVELVLVGESLEGRPLRDEMLVPSLKPALLLDNPRDLVAHNLRQLVAVGHDIRRDRCEEGELLQSFLDDGADASALNYAEHGRSRRPAPLEGSAGVQEQEQIVVALQLES